MKVYETELLMDEIHRRLFDAHRQLNGPDYKEVEFISSSCRATNPSQIIDALYRVGPSCVRICPLIEPRSQTALTRIILSAYKPCYETETLDIIEGLLGNLTPVPQGLTIKQELEQLAGSLR